MPHSPSRGLLYSAPPTPESNRRDDADATEASADSTPAPADD